MIFYVLQQKITIDFLQIYVVGDTGTGKSALISQFSTSEYRNAFADEIGEYGSELPIDN